ncbi:hypothetical protein Tco_0138626 [Tanacetum coccineum]
MAYTLNSSGSDTEVQSCSKNCVKAYEKLQKQFDEQRQTLSKANLEVVAYQLGLESVEAQLVVHQKKEAVYKKKIAVLEFKVKDKNKTGLGYGDQLNENDSSGSELFNSVFDSRSSDGDDNQTNDRFKKDNGYHVVPPPLTGNYMPPLADLSFAGLDDSVYRPTANKTSASVSQVETSTSQTSNTSVEMPRVESVRPSRVIIEDWVSDDEDIFQSNDLQATDKPSFKRIEFTNARNEFVKPKQAEKPRIITQNPKVDRRDWNGQMTQKLGLGFGFTKKACFVCGSYIHLIKDCDFHEKRMAKKSILKNMGKHISQREIRPVWNSAQVNGVNTAGQIAISTVKGNEVTAVKASAGCVWRPKMTDVNNVSKDNRKSITSFESAFDDEDLDTSNSLFTNQVMGAEADFNNMEPSIIISPIPTTRVHSIHPKNQIIGDLKLVVQTRGMSKKNSGEHAMISYIQKQRRTNHKDFQNCLFAYFLSQQEPTKIAQSLDDENWVEAMQEELLQFKIQKV